MATIAKNFRVKNGLVVEGTTATVNGVDILTKNAADQQFIIDTVGGSGTSAATPDTLVLRDANGDFSANEVTAASVVLNGSDLATTLSTNDTAAQGYANTAQAAAESTAAADATAKDATNLTAAKAYADQAELDAVATATATASADATSKAAAALASAETYADTAEADAISAAALDATSKANAALTSAQAYADTAETDAVATAKAYTDTEVGNIGQLSNDYVDLLVGDVTVDGTAGNTVTDRVASAVSDLVGGAPELLDTLSEIAAAIADDANFSTTVISDIAQGLTDAKAYTNTREGVITTAYQSYADTAEADAVTTAAGDATTKADAALVSAKTYADTAEADAIATASGDATTKANAALASAKTYADTAEADAIATASSDATAKANSALTSAELYADTAEADAVATASSDATAKANAALTSANTFTTTTVDALTTDDIAEGTNEYYTSTKATTDAANLLVGATKTNIVITGDENGLVITAENGIADSTTTDLVEGSNLYFTDQRAVDALQAVTPVFTEVDINSIALNVASTVAVATQNTTGTVYSFDSGTYTSAKFVVKADTGSHTEVTEILVTLDSSLNVAITEYALVNTGGSLMDVSAVMNGTNVDITATVVNDNTTVRATGTLIA